MLSPVEGGTEYYQVLQQSLADCIWQTGYLLGERLTETGVVDICAHNVHHSWWDLRSNLKELKEFLNRKPWNGLTEIILPLIKEIGEVRGQNFN